MNTKNNNKKNSSSSSSPSFTPCGCQCTFHDLVTNCQSCGYIFCTEDKKKYLAINVNCENFYCPFCNTKLKGLINFKQYENPSEYPIESSLPVPSINSISNDEMRSIHHRDKLIQYDREFAKRTIIRDLQSDYYNNENNVWLNEDEKKIIKKLNQKKMNLKYKQKKNTKIDIHLNLEGNKIFESNSNKKIINKYNNNNETDSNDDSNDNFDDESDDDNINYSYNNVNNIKNLIQNKNNEKVLVCSPFLDQKDDNNNDNNYDYYEELLFKSKSAFDRIEEIQEFVDKNIKKDKLKQEQDSKSNTYRVEYID